MIFANAQNFLRNAVDQTRATIVHDNWARTRATPPWTAISSNLWLHPNNPKRPNCHVLLRVRVMVITRIINRGSPGTKRKSVRFCLVVVEGCIAFFFGTASRCTKIWTPTNSLTVKELGYKGSSLKSFVSNKHTASNLNYIQLPTLCDWP